MEKPLTKLEVLALAQDFANKTNTVRVLFQRADDQWMHMNAQSFMADPRPTDHNIEVVQPNTPLSDIIYAILHEEPK